MRSHCNRMHDPSTKDLPAMQVDTSNKTDAASSSLASTALPREDSSRRYSALPIRTPGAARWQSLAALAGLCLAATCFLPAVQACNSPVIPYKGFSEEVSGFGRYTSTMDAISSVIFAFCTFVLAYSFGALDGLSALLRRVHLYTWSQRVARMTNVYLCIISVVGLAHVVALVIPQGVRNDWLLLFLMTIVPVLAIIHIWRSRKLGTRRWICQSFMGSAFCFLWFSFWFIGYLISKNGRYGLYLSWTSSVVLLLAVVGEARVVARTSWPKTVGLLVISRLPEGHRAGYCPQCDYNLFGLTEMRCPECGRPFTAEEAGLRAPSSHHVAI